MAGTRLRGAASLVKRSLLSPNTLLEELEFFNDYHAFKRQFGFFAEGPAPTDAPRRLLVIGLTDWLAQVKTMGILAKAVQLHGCAPVILTRRGFARSLKYYRVYGFRDVIFFDDFFQPGVSPQASEALEQLFQGPWDLPSIKAFQYRQVKVGQQALATLLRRLHLGRFDVAEAGVRAQVRALLAEGVRGVDAAEAMFAHVRPALGLVSDAAQVGVGEVFERALHRGIPVIQWVASQRDDALALKRYTSGNYGTHPFSLSEDTWEAAASRVWTPGDETELMQDFQERYVEGRWDSYYNRPYGRCLSRQELQDRLGLDPGKKTAVIFPHILWDPTMFWGEDLFDNYEDWLVETVRAACRNTGVNWVIRFHPANVWKLKREGLGRVPLEKTALEARLGTLPSHLTLVGSEAEVNTFSLFGMMDYGVTVRGTVGIEMAAFGIPVLTAGTGRYSGRGFTVDSSNRAEYLVRLERIQEIPRLSAAQLLLAKRYAHALFCRRPAGFSTFRVVFRPVAEADHPFCNNLQIAARSFRDLAEAKDLQAFARWALNSQAEDFLTDAAEAVSPDTTEAVLAHG